LAEYWNGSTWTIQTTPSPVGADQLSLAGVSCISPASCTAVGSYTEGFGHASTTFPLAEYWNGSTWAIQATPSPSSAVDSGLSAVSCTSATSCTAVGSYRSSAAHPLPTLTLAEYWNGSTWTIQSTPALSAYSSELNAVSCTAPDRCTAVGEKVFKRRGTDRTLAERWNGTEWGAQQTRGTSGPTVGALYGVSCASNTSCTAVGDVASDSGTAVTLADSWNGSTWAVQATPNPSGALRSFLGGISCTSSTNCTAVGAYTKAYPFVAPIAEHLYDGTWRGQTTATPASGKGLVGVSCPLASSTCTAVGNYVGATISDDQTLAEQN
jgi:hypothetical protein